jgi:hypothetical protein
MRWQSEALGSARLFARLGHDWFKWSVKTRRPEERENGNPTPWLPFRSRFLSNLTYTIPQ